MDWFESLTGFRETGYEQTRQQLELVEGSLRSKANGRSFCIGTLALPSLHQLRDQVKAGTALPGRLRVRVVRGDVRSLHRDPEHEGALFQVASQFNMLEMTSPSITPEHGVTRYQSDPTQGPACAIAAGAATIYRNYFAMVDGMQGQTVDRQLDGIRDLGVALGAATGKPAAGLWTMRNGYAMCSAAGLGAITACLASLDAAGIDTLRGTLRVGVHSGVEVTDTSDDRRQLVSQAFCSALPVAYGSIHASHWRAFATLVLEAAYEATMWAAVLNALRTGSKIVLLTRLGGGAFGNDDAWIDDAMRRAFELARGYDLDARIVSYGTPSRALQELASEY